MSYGGWLRAHEDDFLSLLFWLSVCLVVLTSIPQTPFIYAVNGNLSPELVLPKPHSKRLDITVNLSNLTLHFYDEANVVTVALGF